MTDADLITLAEREQARLTNEGDNAAAAIMRALVDRVGLAIKRELPYTPSVTSSGGWAGMRGVVASGGGYPIETGGQVSTTVPERIIPRAVTS